LFRWRRLLLVPIVGAIALALGLATYVWMSNTRDLETEQVFDEPVAPGQTITVALDDGAGCGPSYERLYRESLGRWRQTHRGDNGTAWVRDETPLWSWPRSRTEFSDLPCPISDTATLTIPDDVTWTPVVACDFDHSRCVRLNIAVG
jgi:hypothetical protein